MTWTGELIRSLYKHGVRNAVISPGSRSTPITLAAAIHPGIKKKVVLDERSAAFIALGMAKASGIPALLICTSGTALANYFPAVVEARQSGVPMIILSADRPPHLRSVGSSQTIDHIKFFGDYTHFFHDTGEPVDYETDLKRIQYLGKQAVTFSIEQNGPVHINLPFRKPLEPDQKSLTLETEKCLTQFEEQLESTSYPLVEREIRPGIKITELLNKSVKPLVICGPAEPSHHHQRQIETLSHHLKAPVISEPGSSGFGAELNIHRYEQFLRDQENLELLKPDLIIRFGNQPFTKSILESLQKWDDVPLIHFHSRNDSQDHALSVSHQIQLLKNDTLNLTDISKKGNSKWHGLWKMQETNAESGLRSELKEAGRLTDGHVVHSISKQISPEWNVMISNSFTARDMALFGDSSTVNNQYVNRGAAGIDGIISTASGILAATGKPTCVLTGDLAFFHDSNALLSLGTLDSAPLAIVIINNGGGTIFRMLPVYDSETLQVPAQLYETYFETPQTSAIHKLAESASVSYIKISDIKSLHKLNLNQLSEHTIIECVTDADHSMILRKQLWSG